MAYFNQVDVYEIEQELEVGKRAQDEGWHDRPASAEVGLDDPQRSILAAINDRLSSAHSLGGELLKSIEVKLGTIDLGATFNALRALKADTEMQIDRTKGKFRDPLIGLRRRERSMRRELNAFQQRNGLLREPEYPESEILHWAIVVALIVTESLANSYFFAKGSDLGLLGGAFQALLISCVNVGAALITGVYLLRSLHHIQTWRNSLAGGGLCVYLIFVGFFNLATAHYRAQLGIDPLTALVNVFKSLFKNPFAINDFDATILLFIGIIFSVAALAKAYMADDRYPGYGKVDRLYRDADDAYQEGKGELREALHAVVFRGREILNDHVVNARNASHEFASRLAEAENIANEYSHHVEALREARNTLLNIYRSTNRKVRSSTPPEYFDDYPPLETGDSLPKAELNREKMRGSEIEADLVRIENVAIEKMEELKAVNDAALKDVEAFFKEIEQEAEQQIARDAVLVSPKSEAN